MAHPDRSSLANAAECSSPRPGLGRLAAALEASWDHRTAYRGVTRTGNPAFGQCYPTSRVVQFFYPEAEIACGEVWTGAGTECHFWNVVGSGADAEWIDLSWTQFPAGSIVRDYTLLDRRTLGDSPATVERCDLLLRRVLARLASPRPAALPALKRRPPSLGFGSNSAPATGPGCAGEEPAPCTNPQRTAGPLPLRTIPTAGPSRRAAAGGG